MKKLNVLVAIVFGCVSMTSFGQVFSGSGTMNVEAELVIPLTVSGTLLDFQKVAIPATGNRYYHVQGDGSMYSAATSTATTADGAQTDFEGSPTVSTVTIKGTPSTAIQLTAAAMTTSLNSSGELKLSLGGNIKVVGQDDSSPSTPGVYTGTTTLSAQY
ncbi:MAG: hypothetical protein GKR88_09285 [Flavobacteriaceae bacterium]|nr:MAG: hypothetical protein GKR88_09285 [Flavobacteriaceae bacterium]